MKTADSGELKEALWDLRDMVNQHCMSPELKAAPPFDSKVPVFSGFIACNASAIRRLGEYGIVEVKYDNGERVIGGELLTKLQTAELLKTGYFAEKL